jgi:hypothetical protein
LVLSQQKNSGKNVEQAETFDMLIGQFRPFYEIQKIWDFQYFWANLATFFLSKFDFEQNWS